MNSVRRFVSILLLGVFCKNVWNACTQCVFKCRVSLYQIVKMLHAVIVGYESVGIFSVITCKMCCSEPHWALLMFCSSTSSKINKQAGSLHAWKHHKWFCYFLSDDGDYFLWNCKQIEKEICLDDLFHLQNTLHMHKYACVLQQGWSTGVDQWRNSPASMSSVNQSLVSTQSIVVSAVVSSGNAGSLR